MARHRRSRRGHTLIETVVVMAIILIVMGILAPCLAKALKMSRKAAGQAERR